MVGKLGEVGLVEDVCVDVVDVGVDVEYQYLVKMIFFGLFYIGY